MDKNTKVCLVFIYNHNYEANIDKLEKIYGSRFKHIFHLMPFYNGNKKNVIPVYQSSYFFCDFVRQGLQYFYNENFTHYIFCADDLILNSIFDENNIISILCKEDMEAGFITQYNELSEKSIYNWFWTPTVLNSLLYNNGCQFLRFLPSYEDACQKIEKHGLPSKNISENLARKALEQAVLLKDNYAIQITEDCFNSIKNTINIQNNKFIYPLVKGFSDFFILPASRIKEVSRLFGIFSSGSIFVEVTIPTSMLLCLDKVYTTKDTSFHTSILWGEDRNKLLDRYKSDFNKFYEDFPKDLLYVHPVKLSQWKMEK